MLTSQISASIFFEISRHFLSALFRKKTTQGYISLKPCKKAHEKEIFLCKDQPNDGKVRNIYTENKIS